MRFVFLFVFLIILLVFSVELGACETVCSFKGPDTSQDALKLTEFAISNGAKLFKGDKVKGEFKLTYVGPKGVTFDDKYGVSLKTVDPDGKIRYFGNSHQGETLKESQYITVKTEVTLDKAGNWKIWPNYCLSGKTTSCYDEWHTCYLTVYESCSDGCKCLTQTEAVKYGYGYCGGKQSICGYDYYQNPMYCYKTTPEQTPTSTPTPTSSPTATQTQSPATASQPEVEVSPSKPKKGETFNVRVNLLNAETIIILVNGEPVKECLMTSTCEYQGEATEDGPIIGTTSTVGGVLMEAGRHPWSPGLCSDSDGGIIPYKPGMTVNESSTRDEDTGVIYLPPMYYDICINSTHIREYYCDGDSLKSVIRGCARCIESPEMVVSGGGTVKVSGDYCICQDTDEGRNFFERGYTGTEEGIQSDYCIDSNSLKEYYCTNDGEPAEMTEYCEFTRVYAGGSYTNPLECKEGACVCEDTDGGINYYEKGYVPSATNVWFEDECITEGINGELKEYYVELEPLLYNSTYTATNRIFRCTVKDVTYTCEGDCRDGACVPNCYDGVQNGDEEGVDCGGSCLPCYVYSVFPCNVKDIPDSFDWRNYGIFPDIRNQAACGSCWAFSAIGAMEGKYNLERMIDGNPPDLNINISEQYLVSDCMSGSCKGGFANKALKFARDNGIVEESCMPYRSQLCLNVTTGACLSPCSCGDGKCSDPCSCSLRCAGWSSSLWTIGNYRKVSNDIDEIKKAIYCYGPLSACTDNWDHCIVLVGYDDATGNWTIRNSWGPGWGNNGYWEIPYSGHRYSDLKNDVYYVTGVRSP